MAENQPQEADPAVQFVMDQPDHGGSSQLQSNFSKTFPRNPILILSSLHIVASVLVIIPQLRY
jgi:hypothetical protein